MHFSGMIRPGLLITDYFLLCTKFVIWFHVIVRRVKIVKHSNTIRERFRVIKLSGHRLHHFKAALEAYVPPGSKSFLIWDIVGIILLTFQDGMGGGHLKMRQGRERISVFPFLSPPHTLYFSHEKELTLHPIQDCIYARHVL